MGHNVSGIEALSWKDLGARGVTLIDNQEQETPDLIYYKDVMGNLK